MRLVQLLVTHGLVLLSTLLVPCLSVTFEDGTSGERSEARGKTFHSTISRNMYRRFVK